MPAGARILLADDDPDCREMYSEMLSHAGHRVVTAADGEEAIAYATRFPFDLIILDLALPKLDGFAVLKQLRRTPGVSGTPVITVSAGEAEMHARARASGADLALEKPCLPAELERSIRAFVDRKRRPSP